jgi:2-polyprenyl-6-hydroxyphenyl methylase/3-demethylubiquinone-9 3-methyltransferase
MSRSYQRHVYIRALALAREHGFRSVIDVGCGPATKLVEILRPAVGAVVGVDVAPAIEYCRRAHAGAAEFHIVDLERPALALGRTFDLVVCSDVIEHLADPDPLLRFLPGLLAPGGLIVLSTPEREALRGAAAFSSGNPEHVREWNRAELAAYLDARGFTILEHRLLPPMGLVRGAVIRVVRTALDQLRHGRGLLTCQLVVCRPRAAR